MTMRGNASLGVRAALLVTITMIACAVPCAAGPAAGGFHDPAPSAVPWRIAAPVLRLALAPFCARSVPLDHAVLDRDQGWTRVGFEVRDRGLGVYLDVGGRAQFDRAEIVFTDGEMASLDLGHVVRGRGLYELMTFEDEREVLCVRLLARARSSLAHVDVKIGR